MQEPLHEPLPEPMPEPRRTASHRVAPCGRTSPPAMLSDTARYYATLVDKAWFRQGSGKGRGKSLGQASPEICKTTARESNGHMY